MLYLLLFAASNTKHGFLAWGAHIVAVNVSRKTVLVMFAAAQRQTLYMLLLQQTTQITLIFAQGAHIVAWNCAGETVFVFFAADWHNLDSIVRVASVLVSDLDVAIQQTRIGVVDQFNRLDTIWIRL